MLTAARQKLITSLQQKKFRTEHQLFVVEGVKIISEFILRTDLIAEVFATDEALFSPEVIAMAKNRTIEICVSDERTLRKLSTLTTSQNCIALAKIPIQTLNISTMLRSKIIALDNIQDPGNLGTIIRTADWFGINTIVCSAETVDCYNPKVVQASMGSLSNVSIFYTDLKAMLIEAKTLNLNIYGTLLEGEDINAIKWADTGILLLGNEANGISNQNKEFITHPITIKKAENAYAESLNVAIATAICCSKW